MRLFVMSGTLVKNLLKGPATRMYPKKKRVYCKITRGRIENAIEKCIFCGLCARRCPTYALAVSKEGGEWTIDRLKCCVCNLCVEICPVTCLTTENHYLPPVTEKIAGIATNRRQQNVSISQSRDKSEDPASSPE